MIEPRPREQEAPSSGGKRLPRHIAFIMDGNGRWARSRGLVRFRGHEEGAKALRRVTRHCRALGIKEVTFFALSTENYSRRPRLEIKFLLGLLKRYLIDERPELLENDIRLKAIGQVEVFPPDVLAELTETEHLTESDGSMVMRLALNYGARQEILGAVRGIVEALRSGELTAEQVRTLTSDDFRRYLQDPEMADPDLVIRTAGEWRLSNFLLWQSSYSEIWVTPTFWPDFGEAELEEALRAYETRVRKFGAVGPAEKDAVPARSGLDLRPKLELGPVAEEARGGVARGE